MPLEKIYADCDESMKRAFTYALQEVSMLNLGAGTEHLSGEQRLQLMEQVGGISEICKVRCVMPAAMLLSNFATISVSIRIELAIPPSAKCIPLRRESRH